MITKLTDDQVALMSKVRDDWINLCLYAGDELDLAAARTGIEWMYGMAGLKAPKVILVDSPLGVQYAANILLIERGRSGQVYDQVSDQVRGQVYDQVRGQVYDQVRGQVSGQVRGQVYDQVRGQVYDQVRGQVSGQVRGQVYDQVRGQVRGQVYDQVSDQVSDQVRGQVRGQVYDQVRGQVYDQVRGQVRGQKLEAFSWGYEDLAWAGYYSWFDFFAQIGVVKHDGLKKYLDYLQSGVFMSVFLSDYAIICRRSSFIARDVEHNLHNDHRAAIEWRDGYKLHYLQGEYFDEKLWTKITSQTITAKEVMQIEDSDQRTIAISMLKPGELLKQLKATLIDTGSEGTKLYECKNFMGTRRTEYCMWMKDASTPREFIEFVPPEVGKRHSAVYAQANAFGIPEEDYLLITERG